jgi:hypothetical protein
MPALPEAGEEMDHASSILSPWLTLVGINVTDAYLLANYHKVINFLPNACEEKEQKISIQQFAGILTQQLIDMAKKISTPPQRFLPEESEGCDLEV